MTDANEIEPNDRDIDSATVQQEVLRIVAENGDQAAPVALLEAAKAPDSPLHKFFTWDDSEAGQRYRIAQAGALYRRVTLKLVRADHERREVVFETVRAVTSVPQDRKKTDSASYGRTTVVMNDSQKRESVLRGIVRDLVALRNKYQTYSELRDVWVVIDDAAMMFDPPSTKRKAKGADATASTPAA